MPRIKSLLNGEVSNVRGDIAREMIKLGVAEALDPLEENKQKGLVTVTPDGTVFSPGEPAYRVPKYGDASNPAPHFYVGVHEGRYASICFLFVQLACNAGLTSSISRIQICLAPRPSRTAVFTTNPLHVFGPPPRFSLNSTRSPRL